MFSCFSMEAPKKRISLRAPIEKILQEDSDVNTPNITIRKKDIQGRVKLVAQNITPLFALAYYGDHYIDLAQELLQKNPKLICYYRTHHYHYRPHMNSGMISETCSILNICAAHNGIQFTQLICDYLNRNKILDFLDTRTSLNCNSALHTAASAANPTVVKTLLDHNANCYLFDRWRNTALHTLIYNMDNHSKKNVLRTAQLFCIATRNLYMVEGYQSRTPLQLCHMLKNQKGFRSRAQMIIDYITHRDAVLPVIERLRRCPNSFFINMLPRELFEELKKFI